MSTTKRSPRWMPLITAGMLAGVPLMALADKTWIGPGSPTDDSKWNPSGVPGTNDVAIWDGTSNLDTLYVGGAMNVKGLRFESSMTGDLQLQMQGLFTLGKSGIVMAAQGRTVSFSKVGDNRLWVGADQTWTVASNCTLHMSAPMGGSNALTLAVFGTLKIGGMDADTNTLTGTMTISAGVVEFAGANKKLMSSGQTIINGGCLNIGAFISHTQGVGNVTVAAAYPFGDTIRQNMSSRLAADSYTGTLTNGNAVIAVALEGSGGLTMAGAGGTLTLNQACTYSGETVVSAGTLALSGSGSITNSSAIRVGEGGTLSLTGIAGNFQVRSNQVFGGCSVAGTGTVNAASKTVSCAAQARLVFEADGAGYTVGKVRVNGNLSLTNNVVTVNVVGAPLGAGSYRLLECTGTLSGRADTTPTFTGSGLARNHAVSVSTTNGAAGSVSLNIVKLPEMGTVICIH